ncbi:MAG TPA: cation:proton antiporter [Kribbella sp.]|nr:cation:proton antiporter [Kribbella sp.]
MVLTTSPVAPMGGHELLVLLLQLGSLLGLALILGRLAVLLRMPAVVGELAAGVLLGPSLLAHVAPGLSAWLLPRDPVQQHLLDAIGLLGVLLLVGITGMHLDLGLVRRQGVAAAWVSAGGLMVPLVAGIGVGFLLPTSVAGTDRPIFAMFLGVALCVSAIPVISKILLEMRLLHRTIGQLIMSAAAVDDIAGWLLLSIVSATATHGLRAGHVVWAVASLAGVVAAAALIGRPLVTATLRLAGRSSEPGVRTAAAVVLVLLFSAGTQAVGLEPIFGAFLGGLLISASGLLDLRWLAPLRTIVMTVLAPIFFATAGLRMDLTSLASPAVLLSALGVLVVAIVGKFVGAYVGARAVRLHHWEALALGAGLNARGVIGVVVAMVGLRLGVLGTEAYTIVVLVAIVTSLMAPPILRSAVTRIAVTAEDHEREKAFREAA